MRPLASFQEIFLHRLPVDGRKQIYGLSEVVQNAMEKSPFSSALFVFTSKRRDQLRLLYWDKTGFALWTKKLEKSRFRWPTSLDQDVVELSVQELNWLLEGIDITKVRPHEELHFTSL